MDLTFTIPRDEAIRELTRYLGGRQPTDEEVADFTGYLSARFRGWVEENIVPWLETKNKSRCQNCRRIWNPDELKHIKDIFERVDPGEPMPSGECPDCGALCEPLKPS
jgi:hypothetical protein